ncbi:MAG: hypothetical protein K8S23_07750 [Candidatus Cloacimonetes bacterium]|nr:hypothetical protein [Candidatus Cloacimonadota bacterium]
MDLEKINYYYNKFKFGEDNFHNLMKKRVHEVLLVSTFYDAFIFEQDGRLSEQIHGEYQQLNLSTAPRFTSVPTGEAALKILIKRKFDLVITMIRIGDIDPFYLSDFIKKKFPNTPVVLLLNSTSDIAHLSQMDQKIFDEIFLWNGDSKLFLAMIKSIEDKANVKYDTQNGLVRVILLVEDSIHYYSRFLPLLYSEIMKQTQRLISEELNDINKRLRMRARPKVLLVHTYEDALNFIEKYRDYLIAVISDVEYSNQGNEDKRAGFKLLQKVQKDKYDIPVLLQSSEIHNREKAFDLNIDFLHKNSKTLLRDLRKFIVNNLGFGDFIFRTSDDNEINRIVSIHEFEKILKTIPVESLLYHSSKNHFSAWLTAHGEFLVAKRIRKIGLNDFDTSEELRNFLILIFKQVRNLRSKGQIISYKSESINLDSGIIRLADGSLGGKGRSLAFLNSLLVSMEFEKDYPEMRIQIPKTFIIGTNEFDIFIEHNNIGDEITDFSDVEIKQIFLDGDLTDFLKSNLLDIVSELHYPLAVRSSGLLEDSQFLPFAGIYETFMIPNNHQDEKTRFKQLTNAIKLVFSSIYLKKSRQYIESINYKLEEEKMAVIIQRVAGSKYDKYFYPHISGVAQSYNYYPTSSLKHSEGITSIALGLGKAVVEGMKTFRFCPHHPKKNILQPAELIKNSQVNFFGIDLEKTDFDLKLGEIINYAKLDLKKAEEHGTIKHLVSIWDHHDHKYVFNLNKKGARVLNFASILKYNYLPIANILKNLTEIGEKAMGVPVEIEFAINLTTEEKQNIKPVFYVLQIRPLTINRDEIKIDLDSIKSEEILIKTKTAMGNGIIKTIQDIVYLDHDLFENTKTVQMVSEIEKINKNVENYILIGPGRWGSRDRFLGVPVKWNQICNAKVIIETTLKDFSVEASQGTHFFHNMISMDTGYFLIDNRSEFDFIDWKWIKKQTVVMKTKHFVHIHLDKPVLVKIDGRTGISIIYKENKEHFFAN